MPAALAALVVVVAYVDQGGKDTPPYDLTHAQYASDSDFFATVHDRLGDGASVFNLPYLAFPEVPPRVLMGAYDEAAGYIFQPTLNWSFGFMRGRDPDYPKVLETQPVSEWMTSIAAIGFTGIVVDGAGYTAEERASQESQIAELAGAPTVSADGRYSFFDLQAFVTDVRAQLGDDGVKARAAETLAVAVDISLTQRPKTAMECCPVLLTVVVALSTTELHTLKRGRRSAEYTWWRRSAVSSE